MRTRQEMKGIEALSKVTMEALLSCRLLLISKLQLSTLDKNLAPLASHLIDRQPSDKPVMAQMRTLNSKVKTINLSSKHRYEHSPIAHRRSGYLRHHCTLKLSRYQPR